MKCWNVCDATVLEPIGTLQGIIITWRHHMYLKKFQNKCLNIKTTRRCLGLNFLLWQVLLSSLGDNLLSFRENCLNSMRLDSAGAQWDGRYNTLSSYFRPNPHPLFTPFLNSHLPEQHMNDRPTWMKHTHTFIIFTNHKWYQWPTMISDHHLESEPNLIHIFSEITLFWAGCEWPNDYQQW